MAISIAILWNILLSLALNTLFIAFGAIKKLKIQ